MKPFINNLLPAISLCILLAACSSSNEEPTLPAIEETIIVQETVLPPAEKSTQAPATPSSQAAAPKTISEPAGQGLINLKAWDKKLKFLKTYFEQITKYDGVLISQSKGNLFYDKSKNMLRLDTLDTDGKTEQSAITDKQKILILDGQGKEITTLSWKEWQQGQPNQALFDFGNYTALLARHKVVIKEPYLLELTPKEGNPYTLYLTLSQEDYFPTRIKIVSDLMVTESTLSNIQKNEELPFDIFRDGGVFK